MANHTSLLWYAFSLMPVSISNSTKPLLWPPVEAFLPWFLQPLNQKVQNHREQKIVSVLTGFIVRGTIPISTPGSLDSYILPIGNG